MRLVLVILIGLCVWLLAERQKLSDGVGGMESRLSTMEKEKDQLQVRLVGLKAQFTQPAAAPAPVKRNWLQERIEQNPTSLDGQLR